MTCVTCVTRGKSDSKDDLSNVTYVAFHFLGETILVASLNCTREQNMVNHTGERTTLENERKEE